MLVKAVESAKICLELLSASCVHIQVFVICSPKKTQKLLIILISQGSFSFWSPNSCFIIYMYVLLEEAFIVFIDILF